MPSKLTLNSPITSIPGIGSTYKAKLHLLGIENVEQFLYFFPFRYEDLSNINQIVNLEVGEIATITAKVWQITKINTRTGKTMIKATLSDGSGSIEAVWFNQNYLLTVLRPNQVFNFSGKVSLFARKLTLVGPKYEAIQTKSETIHTGRLIPIYSQSQQISTRWRRTKLHQILKETEINEIIPEQILTHEKLLNRRDALEQIHFPNNLESLAKARERLAFEEFLFLYIRNALAKKKLQKKVSKTWATKKTNISEFEAKLPFKLTSSQKQVINEITQDLAAEKPMNRLLQGEVGSGKTIVAAFAMFLATKNNHQAGLLAPTEILAKQHFLTLTNIFKHDLKIELITSSNKLKADQFDILVGTHSLLAKKKLFGNLGLLVIDEQQRFGVKQRQKLLEEYKSPHLLSMTATPIPRTLAMALYGNLEMSHLTELPSGTKKIKTYAVPENKRASAYKFVEKEVSKGAQGFVICPLIEETESDTSVKSAISEYEKLKTGVFKKLRLGLLHGKLTSGQKDSVLNNFRHGKIDILVSTPVVEVGIDIKAASIMLIEAADRFGLSSLHQLRGRIGRSGQESYCLLFSESRSNKAQERLAMLSKSNDGLELAEFDLKLRGPGDFFGTIQHGDLEFKTAEFISLNILKRSKETAINLVESGSYSDLLKNLPLDKKNKLNFSTD